MKKMHKSLAIAMGTTLITGLTSIAAHAETISSQGSVFEMTELSSGYMQLAAADTAAKPSESKAKSMEGKCAGAQPMSAPKSGDTTKSAEGKCGEGKCGAAMKKSATDNSSSKPTDANTVKK